MNWNFAAKLLVLALAMLVVTDRVQAATVSYEYHLSAQVAVTDFADSEKTKLGFSYTIDLDPFTGSVGELNKIRLDLDGLARLTSEIGVPNLLNDGKTAVKVRTELVVSGQEIEIGTAYKFKRPTCSPAATHPCGQSQWNLGWSATRDILSADAQQMVSAGPMVLRVSGYLWNNLVVGDWSKSTLTFGQSGSDPGPEDDQPFRFILSYDYGATDEQPGPVPLPASFPILLLGLCALGSKARARFVT